jgi:hypothetical protein
MGMLDGAVGSNPRADYWCFRDVLDIRLEPTVNSLTASPDRRLMSRPETARARPREPTEICVTVDTEFSIGGNFRNPELTPIAEPIVLGRIGDKEEGLGFLLDCFAEFGVRATFFVEALQTAYFGDKPMGGIARGIAAAGHDVQLHLHPCWLHYDSVARARFAKAPNDSCAGRSEAELDYFFEFGLSAFSRWGLPTPVAVRTGNFEVDSHVFHAAARCGLRVSSNIAVPIHRPSEERLVLVGGKHWISRILELSVFCYNYQIWSNPRLRTLCITACSSAEMIFVLQQARAHQLSPVVILTHPQEYVKKKDDRYTTLRRNRVNQTRLRALLKFLDQNRDDFVAVPISAIRGDGAGNDLLERPAISVPSAMALARMLENGINDRIWRYLAFAETIGSVRASR